MTGHKLARQLLSLPDIEVFLADGATIGEVVDKSHSEFVERWKHHKLHSSSSQEWFDSQPKKRVIIIKGLY